MAPIVAAASEALWNQRTGSVHRSPEPVVRSGDVSSAKCSVAPSTTAISLPPGPPPGLANREQPKASTHSTSSCTCRVPAGAVNDSAAPDLNASGQSFTSGAGAHDTNGSPIVAPAASVADSV